MGGNSNHTTPSEARRPAKMTGHADEPDLNAAVMPETAGLRLCKIDAAGALRIAETVIFERGRSGVLTTLSRAALSGHVGGQVDKDTRFWVDQMDVDDNNLGELRLDRESWNALKNRWMRCKMVPA